MLIRFEMKWPAQLLARIEQWRLAQEIQPTRTEAIRTLVDRGLKSEGEDGQAAHPGTERQD